MSHPLSHTYPILRARIFGAARSTKPALLLIIALLFAGTLFTLFTVAPRALADELSPAAPGSIAGVVRNAQGEPLAGISVTLYKLSSNQSNSWRAIRSTMTAANGTYRFPLLLIGVYRIGTIDPNKAYAEAYYPAATKLDQGADITVLGNQLATIDLILQPSSQIRGVITWTETLSVTDTYIELFQQLEGQNSSGWQPIRAIYVPSIANSGIYSFTGLSADSYRVCARGNTLSFSIYECYDNVYEVSRATNLTLTVGAILNDVNILLGDRADYAQISGRVTTVNNEPLADIEVYASPVAQLWPMRSSVALRPRSTLIPLSLQRMITSPSLPDYSYLSYLARTDNQGNYTFPRLTAGEYILSFRDPEGHYAFAYYGNAQIQKWQPSSKFHKTKA